MLHVFLQRKERIAHVNAQTADRTGADLVLIRILCPARSTDRKHTQNTGSLKMFGVKLKFQYSLRRVYSLLKSV